MKQIPEDVHVIKCPGAWFDVPGLDLYMAIYLFEGSEMGLVDSGCAADSVTKQESNVEKDVFPYMKKHGLDPTGLKKVVNTHGMIDHFGGNFILKEKVPTIKIAAHKLDAPWIEDHDLHYREFFALWPRCFPAAFLKVTKWQWDVMGGKNTKVDIQLEEGDVIRMGDRDLTVIHTPGHSPGHLALYDESDRILLTGDAIQGSGGAQVVDPLASYDDVDAYLKTIDKIEKMNVDTILAAHAYRPFTEAVVQGADVKRFLKESREYVKWLEGLIVDFLEKWGPQNLCEVAKYCAAMAKGLFSPFWMPPNMQTLRATGAHLRSLQTRGKARYSQVDQTWEMAT